MANIQTMEFVKLPVSILDAVNKSLADGAFKPIEDLPNFIAPLLSVQAAIDGIKDIPQELATMTQPEAEGVKSAIKNALPSFTGMDQYDLTEGLNGVLALVRYAYRKGWEKGEEALKADLKSGIVTVEDL